MKTIDAQDYVVKDLVSKTPYTEQQIIAWLTDPDEPLSPKEILSTITQSQVINQTPNPSTSKQIKPERMEERALEAIAPKTGMKGLDAIIRGFIPGHLYTLSGETNIGKSSLAANFAVAVAKQGKSVIYVALEPDNTIIDYFASIVTNKKFEDITEGDYDEIPENILIYKKDVIDTPEKLVKTLREKERYDLVIIDHIGYFTTTVSNNKTERESNVVKAMVSIAKEKKCAIIQIAHLRKGDAKARKKYPSINDIGGSGAFTKDATDVMIAYRDPDSDDKYGLSFLDTGAILLFKAKVSISSGKSVPIKFFEGKATIKELLVEHPFNPF